MKTLKGIWAGLHILIVLLLLAVSSAVMSENKPIEKAGCS